MSNSDSDTIIDSIDDDIIENSDDNIKRKNKSSSNNPNKKKKSLNDDNCNDIDNSSNDNNSNGFIILLNSIASSMDDIKKIRASSNIATNNIITCRNPLCNHKTFEEDSTSINTSTITIINNINDLIIIGGTYHCKKNIEYMKMDLRIIYNMIPPLLELNNMIGMKNIKQQLVNQILFFLLKMNKTSNCGVCYDCISLLPCKNIQDDMLHTIITGPPGVGKTHLGKILGKLYKEMEILSNGEMKIVSRSDLIGEYVGSTALKTQRMIDSCEGGILFIDEAYSLGNNEGRDTFSKECIDTLNRNLSENRTFLCIIAGYSDAINSCFLNYNEGLTRRFSFRYNIEGYTNEELYIIFCNKVHNNGWKLPYEQFDKDTIDYNKIKDNLKNLFLKNEPIFPNYGGDIETLFFMCKIAHARTMSINSLLSLDNIIYGLELFLKNRNYKKTYSDSTLYL